MYGLAAINPTDLCWFDYFNMKLKWINTISLSGAEWPHAKRVWISKPAAPQCSPPLHRTSGQMKRNKNQKKTKDKNRDTLFALWEPSGDRYRAVSAAAAALMKIPALPREKQGVAYTRTASCTAASRTGGEQRHSKHILRFIYNIIVLIWQPFSVEQSRQSFFDWF